MWRRFTRERAVAEDIIQQLLSERDFSLGCITNKGFTFTKKEIEKYGVYGTLYDRFWSEFNYVVFLDGPPHLKSRQQWKDTQIKKVLEARGYTVDRFSYDAPLSDTRAHEIVDDIIAKLTEKDYVGWRERVCGNRTFQEALASVSTPE